MLSIGLLTLAVVLGIRFGDHLLRFILRVAVLGCSVWIALTYSNAVSPVLGSMPWMKDHDALAGPAAFFLLMATSGLLLAGILRMAGNFSSQERR